MADKMTMPSGFGGLLRYDDEYPSKLKMEPQHVVVFIIIVIAIAIGLRMFF